MKGIRRRRADQKGGKKAWILGDVPEHEVSPEAISLWKFLFYGIIMLKIGLVKFLVK